MSRHYEKSRPISETLVAAGGKLFAGLSALFLLLSLVSLISQLVQPIHPSQATDVIVYLAITTLPLFLLSLICFAAYRFAKRGSFTFYWLVAAAVLFVIVTVAVILKLFDGFTPG